MKGALRKFSCFIAVLTIILSLCTTVFAESRTEVVLADEDDIIAFLRSSEYDPHCWYSFIIPDPIQTQSLCPSCGRNSYKGYTEHREMDIHPRQCPFPNLDNDMCYEYHVYAYSMCDVCGYTTSEQFVNMYWIVVCSAEMPDGWGEYIARPGQSYRDGYDLHEDPEYMKLI